MGQPRRVRARDLAAPSPSGGPMILPGKMFHVKQWRAERYP